MSSLVSSRYLLPLTRVLGRIRNSTTRTPILSRCAIQDPDPLVKHPQSLLSPQPLILSRTQQHSPQCENAQQCQLFDHRKDDPVRFSKMARPNGATQITKPPTPSPRSSVDYVPTSSTSSYAQSTLSSNFTLSTDGSFSQVNLTQLTSITTVPVPFVSSTLAPVHISISFPDLSVVSEKMPTCCRCVSLVGT